MKVFVIGGTGAIGKPTLRALVEAGHEVDALARSPERAELVRGLGARPVEVSLFDRAELRGAFDGQDAVVNVSSAMPKSWQFPLLRAWRATKRVRTEGSAAAVDAAIDVGVPRYLQESVAMLYADDGDHWIDETGALQRYPQAEGNIAAEASAQRFTESGGTGVVLRFGLFYGPGAQHSEEFLAFARRHFVPVMGRSDSYLSSIHVEDGGRAVVAALEVPAGTYNVVDDEPLTKRAYADAIAAAVGVRRVLRGPGRAALLLGHRMTSMTSSIRASNAKLRGATPWTPQHRSAREGYAAMADA